MQRVPNYNSWFFRGIHSPHGIYKYFLFPLFFQKGNIIRYHTGYNPVCLYTSRGVLSKPIFEGRNINSCCHYTAYLPGCSADGRVTELNFSRAGMEIYTGEEEAREGSSS